MKTTKPLHGGAREGSGRKPLEDGVASLIVPIRLTPDQKAKLQRLGGGRWVRARIDKARDPGEIE